MQDDTASYIYGPGGLLIEQVTAGGTSYYYHTDRLGSVRALTNGSGTVVNTAGYDAYGQPTSTSGSVANPFGYAGEYTDDETGFLYLRARYYDPATQQFLTVDPLLAATEQAYNYAGGAPLNYIDPSGLSKARDTEGWGSGRSQGLRYGLLPDTALMTPEEQFGYEISKGIQAFCDAWSQRWQEAQRLAALSIFGARIRDEIIARMFARGDDMTAFEDYDLEIQSQSRMVQPDYTLPDSPEAQVRYQVRILNRRTGVYEDWSVNYGQQSDSFGIIKPASGK